MSGRDVRSPASSVRLASAGRLRRFLRRPGVWLALWLALLLALALVLYLRQQGDVTPYVYPLQ